MAGISNFSNPIRNLIALLKKQSASLVNSDGVNDILINYLKKSFEKSGIKVFDEINIKGISDIDFPLIGGKTLFIAECKNIYPPTDIYETRTTLDAIYKANRQLDRIMDALNNKNVREVILKSNGIPMNIEIVPFIITGNRIFSNCNVFKYPVRHFSEIDNFITDGKIVIGKDKPVSVWKNKGLSDLDIKEYLSDTHPYYCFMQKSMIETNETIKIGKIKLNITDFVLDVESMNCYCKKNFGRKIMDTSN